jgi:hypothetical protein
MAAEYLTALPREGVLAQELEKTQKMIEDRTHQNKGRLN